MPRSPLALLGVWALLAATPTAVAGLVASPAELRLDGPHDRAQLVVTHTDAAGRPSDATRIVTYKAADPGVVAVSAAGVAVPRRDGRTTLTVTLGGESVTVPVTVATTTDEVGFARQAVPVLTRAGCNQGTCHGTPVGKNGFRLSLRGYDRNLDRYALVREASGRRIDPLDPGHSLLLLKGAALVPHEGGRRFGPGEPGFELLRAWVAGGASDDPTGLPPLASLAVEPPGRVLEPGRDSQQLRVVATFADGRRRDVTHLARLSLSAEGVADVTPDGLVLRRTAGEAVVVAEYMNVLATARIAFLPAVTPSWPDPPANNLADRHVFARLRVLRIEPSGLCTDAEFLRRASLDITGRVPEPDEVRRFLADPSSDKRSRLIDELLERPAYADFWGLKWADRLGCNQRFVGKVGARKYHAWVRHMVAANVHEDEFARTVLTAGGGNYSEPAAGFFRRLRKPDVAAEEVAQLFLGVRMQCAKCHNHPGERWTQDDYHAFAAFFARLGFRNGPFFVGIYDKEETLLTARDGEWSHPRTGATVPPRFLGHNAPAPASDDRRGALAAWLTSPENPFFARAAVNRVWYHLFGRGLVDPVDDLRATNPPSHPELLDALAAEYVRLGFDRKALIRLVANSRTYQLSSRTTPTNAADEQYFSHARVRLLTAEQLLDAVGAATGVPEKFAGFPAGTPAVALPDGEIKHPFLEAFGRPARAMACECERGTDTTFGQALQLVGSRLVEDKVRDDAGRAARLVSSGTADAAVAEELFLATLGRSPTPGEASAVARRLSAAKGDRRRAAEDVLWALVNHREFLFQR
jgi:hypothetical protein